MYIYARSSKKNKQKKYDEYIFIIYNICSNKVMKININGLRIRYVISTVLKTFKLNFKYEFLNIFYYYFYLSLYTFPFFFHYSIWIREGCEWNIWICNFKNIFRQEKNLKWWTTSTSFLFKILLFIWFFTSFFSKNFIYNL